MLHPWLNKTKIVLEMGISPLSQDLRQIRTETDDDSLVCKCCNGDKLLTGMLIPTVNYVIVKARCATVLCPALKWHKLPSNY